MQNELAQPTNGAGLTTLQQAYDNSPTPGAQILLDAVPNPIIIQAQVAGEVFHLHDIAGNEIFSVNADPDTVVASAGVTIQDAFLNSGASVSLTFDDTFTTGGGFIGGALETTGIVTSDNGLFIIGTFAEGKTYRIGATPTFAAYTVMNILPRIENAGNFNLMGALGANYGVRHQRVTAGTSNAATSIGWSNSPAVSATVSGASMIVTTNTALSQSVKWNTVAGGAINMGTIRAAHLQTPAQALFASSAGTETMVAAIGLDVDQLNFGGNLVKVAVRSAITPASNSYFLLNNGGANSDHGNGHMYFDDGFGVAFGGVGVSNFDSWISWQAGIGKHRLFFTANSASLYTSNPAAGRILMDVNNGSAGELNIQVGRCSIGDQSGPNGQQFLSITQGAQASTVNGDFSGVLLTQSGNYTNAGFTMSRVSAWVINGMSYANSSGSVGEADTMTIGGFVTSAPGVTLTTRQSLNVIGGRSRFKSAMQFDPITPAAMGSGNNNNWAGLLTGSANNNMRHWARISGNATTSVLTGIDATAVQDGDTFELTNVSANAIDITHQDAASTAANRIISPTGATYVLGPDETVLVRYDATTTRWRLMGGTGA